MRDAIAQTNRCYGDARTASVSFRPPLTTNPTNLAIPCVPALAEMSRTIYEAHIWLYSIAGLQPKSSMHFTPNKTFSKSPSVTRTMQEG